MSLKRHTATLTSILRQNLHHLQNPMQPTSYETHELSARPHTLSLDQFPSSHSTQTLMEAVDRHYYEGWGRARTRCISSNLLASSTDKPAESSGSDKSTGASPTDKLAHASGTGRLSGRSEQLLGQFCREYPGTTSTRDNIAIATKLATYPWRMTAGSPSQMCRLSPQSL